MVYKLDRLSRSLKDIILTIDELKQLEVDFIPITESIDALANCAYLSTPHKGEAATSSSCSPTLSGGPKTFSS